MIGLIVAAKPLVLILLSEKWISIVPFIQIFALANMFLPIQYINMEAAIVGSSKTATRELRITFFQIDSS